MTRPIRGTAAGRAYLDLQNRTRRGKRGAQELLTMYVVERWLARLSRSTYASDFILKGMVSAIACKQGPDWWGAKDVDDDGSGSHRAGCGASASCRKSAGT